jgi:hypothetical protein
MDWTQVLAVSGIVISNLGTVIALHFQLDRKIDENRVNLEKKLEENRKETNEIINVIRQDSKNFQIAILEEMKDFHGRMCAIEEKNRR